MLRPGGGERTGPPSGGAAAGGAPRSPPAARSTGPGRAVPAAAARSPVSGAEPSTARPCTAPHRGCLPRPLPGMRWPSGSGREREASVISRNSLPRGDPDPGPVKFRSVPAARLRGRSELCCLLLLRGGSPAPGSPRAWPRCCPAPRAAAGVKAGSQLAPSP